MRKSLLIMEACLICTMFTGCVRTSSSYSNSDIYYSLESNNKHLEQNGIDEVTPAAAMSKRQQLLSAYCLEYNGVIPYVTDATAEEYEMKVNNSKNEVSDIIFSGMDSEGYVKWLYSSIFGENVIEGTLDAYLQKCDKIDVSEGLQVGDICSVDDGFPGKVYGVVAYVEEDGEVIVSLCDALPSEKFSGGSNRLAYLRVQKNEYLGNSEPTTCNIFYRPAVDWEEAYEEK